MASLQPLRSEQIRKPVGESIEVDCTIIVIEEESVVERCCFSSMPQVFLVTQDSIQDEIGQNALFLLPPGFSIVDETVVLPVGLGHPLHNVIPAAALPVGTSVRHQFCNAPC